jgi:transposase
VTAIADAHPGAAVEVWCQDEARYGLIPTQRRVWAPRGKRPTCSSRRRYQWSYLYGFVHPASGSLLPYILPLVNRDAFRISLELFAIDADAGPHRQIVLVVDGAGWHHAAEAAGEIPEHVHLVYLPPYSPELQPCERVWPLANEAIANRSFDDIDHLDSTLAARCRQLMDDPDTIRGVCRFHWWPADVARSRVH